MSWDEDVLYRQFLKRDRALDGKFLTGVLTTGIYCLPSCPAKRPKRENTRFFRTPAEAQEIGLRACRRCHPDEFYRGAAFHEDLYEQTAARVKLKPAAFADIADIAKAAGLSRTALADLFREHAHETPGTFLRRTRVLHACRLLREGARPVDAAGGAGFDSSSSFHDQFLAQTGLTPHAYAVLGERFRLKLPAGYRSCEILDFYGRDLQSVSERVTKSSLEKCVLIDGRAALLSIRFAGDYAECGVEGGDMWTGHHMILRMLGLESNAAGFERQCGGDALLGELVQRQRGLRIPMTPEPWEALAWAVMGQQISLKAAVSLRRGLIENYGIAHSGGLKAHPSQAAVAALEAEALRPLGFSGSKAEYLIAAAGADVPLESLRAMSAARAARDLAKIRGVGPWTVQYVFLRGLGFADCLPAGDAGLARGLMALMGTRPNPAQVGAALAGCAPYRSLAAAHVWASLKGESE